MEPFRTDSDGREGGLGDDRERRGHGGCGPGDGLAERREAVTAALVDEPNRLVTAPVHACDATPQEVLGGIGAMIEGVVALIPLESVNRSVTPGAGRRGLITIMGNDAASPRHR